MTANTTHCAWTGGEADGPRDCKSPCRGKGRQCWAGLVQVRAASVCVHFIAFGAASRCVACAGSCSARGPRRKHDRRTCGPFNSACLLKMMSGCVLAFPHGFVQRVVRVTAFWVAGRRQDVVGNRTVWLDGTRGSYSLCASSRLVVLLSLLGRTCWEYLLASPRPYMNRRQYAEDACVLVL
jgi:hypothetical protein